MARAANKDKSAIDRILRQQVRIALAAVCASLVGLFSGAGDVFAQSSASTSAEVTQDQATQAQAMPAPATQAQGQGELGEITVTATRTEESIVQVPISVTALTRRTSLSLTFKISPITPS